MLPAETEGRQVTTRTQTSETCSACGGGGKAADGTPCGSCMGSGTIIKVVIE